MSSYTAKINRLKQNVVRDHPKKISGGGGSISVMAKKVEASKFGDLNNSSLGPRILNNFSLMKRRVGCCEEMFKDTQINDSSERTFSLGDNLFNVCGTTDKKCAPINPYIGKSYGCGDKCGTVKKVAVAQDYNERIRRLKAGSVLNK